MENKLIQCVTMLKYCCWGQASAVTGEQTLSPQQEQLIQEERKREILESRSAPGSEQGQQKVAGSEPVQGNETLHCAGMIPERLLGMPQCPTAETSFNQSRDRSLESTLDLL